MFRRAFSTAFRAFGTKRSKVLAATVTCGLLGAGAYWFKSTEAQDSIEPSVKQQNRRVSLKEPFPKMSPVDTVSKAAESFKLFSGNANSGLAAEVASLLHSKLGNMKVSRFADGEVNVEVLENVRGKDVFVIQPTCPPVNENMMELLLMVSALRRASARRITAVISYYGYARQDRKMTARVPISAADVARLLESMGVDRVIAVDLHCGQIQGFFGPRVPVDNLDGGPVGVAYFKTKELSRPVVVSPDAGGVYRAMKFRNSLYRECGQDTGLAMIIKQRPAPGEIHGMNLVGSVKGRDAVIVDDMIDSAGTLCKAAKILKDNGANRVLAFASHALFSSPALRRIKESDLEEIVVLNTVPLDEGADSEERILQLSCADLLAEAISRIVNKKSVSEIFPAESDSALLALSQKVEASAAPLAAPYSGFERDEK